MSPRSRGGANVAQSGRLTSVTANRGARRPLAPSAIKPDSKASRPLATTAGTPDSKVTRAKQSFANRARTEGQMLVAAGAEGACQDTDAEHWQRHSSQLGAHLLCCRCNFIKRQMVVKRDCPWCSPRPRCMGSQWRLGCDICARMVEAPELLRDSDSRPGRLARYDWLPHAPWWYTPHLPKHHA